MENAAKLFIFTILGLALILSGCSKDATLDGTQDNVENPSSEDAGLNDETDNNGMTIEEEIETEENTQIIADDAQITEEDNNAGEEEEPSTETSGLCIDSDGGLDYYTKGTITIESDGTKRTYTDYCRTGKFEDYVYEYHCINDTVASENYDCAKGCSDGKCYQ